MINLIHDDLRSLEPTEFDFYNCDPPYSQIVQDNIVSSSPELTEKYGLHVRVKNLPFDPVTKQLMSAIMKHFALAKRWCLLYCDSKSVSYWHEVAKAHDVYARRDLVWNRWSSPQPGNRKPPHTFELILCFHHARLGCALHWNGPGGFKPPTPDDVDQDTSWTFDEKPLRGDAKFDCEKPLDLQLDQMLYFTDPGEQGADLTCGSGTNPIAAWLLGRDCVGVEKDEDTFRIAKDRAARALRGVWERRDIERMARFCVKHPEAAVQVSNTSNCSEVLKMAEKIQKKQKRETELALANMLASDAVGARTWEKKVRTLYGL